MTPLALEFSELCVQHLRSRGIQVFTQPAEEVLPQMERQFDLIVISHVLEHLLDPCTILRVIHTHLAPGGVLYREDQPE